MNKIRNHIIEDYALEPLRYFLPFSLSLYITFCFLRVYEFFALDFFHALPPSAWHLELKGMLYDAVFVLQISLILIVVFGVFNFIHKRLGRIFNIFFLMLCITVYVAILQYFITAFIPLGADFWSYSSEDIKTTISASGGFALQNIIPFFIFIALVILLYNLLRKWDIHKPAAGYVFFVLLVASPFAWSIMPKSEDFENDVDYYLVENKGRYFTLKSLEYFYGREETAAEGLAIAENNPYPLMHTIDYNDVLGPYFNLTAEKPNLVFIQVEGLGKSFVGENAEYGGFTPFLDSLVNQGLSWENFLSTTGRTFGILPSMYGSLPFCAEGFMEMGSSMPDHLTLISLLKKQGYNVNYFYGGNSNFDKQDIFLEYQKIDLLLHEFKFPDSIPKMSANNKGFSWGYADKDVFNYSLEVIKNENKYPRLDIYMTLTTHEPFDVPEKSYKLKFDQMLPRVKPAKKGEILRYRGIFECLLYTDDAIKNFLEAYKQRPDYNNTIFVITGDHRMIPVPHKSRIDRYHVPFLVWSPMVRNPAKFKGVSSHACVAPTFMAFLKKNYGMVFPDDMPFIGKVADVSTIFRSVIEQPIMQNKGDLNQYVMGEYFYTDGALFRIRDNMSLIPEKNDKLKKEALRKLNEFKAINDYVCNNNKLYKSDGASPVFANTAYTFSPEEIKYLLDIKIDSLITDEQFFKARELAFDGKHAEAGIILKHILNSSPNYSDVRILLGRNYMWNGDSAMARKELTEALRRTPDYYDAYIALIDFEMKYGNYAEAKRLTEKGLTLLKDDEELLERQKKLRSLIN